MHLAIGIYRIFPEQIKPHRTTGSRKQEQVIVNAEASATYFPTSIRQITDHEVTTCDSSLEVVRGSLLDVLQDTLITMGGAITRCLFT